MKLEDTKLPNTPLIRAAFKAAAISAELDGATPRVKELMGKNDPLRQPVDAAEILNETVPGASEAQVAATLLFHTDNFLYSDMLQGSLQRNMRNENGRSQDPFDAIFSQRRGAVHDAPSGPIAEVCALSEEWSKVHNKEIPAADASIELKQIIAAINIADLHGIKDDAARIATEWALKSVDTLDLEVKEMGDIQAPALAAKFTEAREETKKALINVPKTPTP